MAKNKQNQPKKKKGKGGPPSLHSGQQEVLRSVSEPPDHNKSSVKYCFSCMRSGFSVSDLQTDAKEAFLQTIERRGNLTWEQVLLDGKHGLGTEQMPSSSIIPSLPPGWDKSSDYTVLRYFGNLPMVGWRDRDVFHIVWVEANYGDVYDHG